MKNLTFLILIFVFIINECIAQVPQAFKYQAVARDNVGDLLVNRNISLRISIIDSAAGGSNVYSEIHKTGTNQFGLFSINIGEGITPTGVFANIPWETGNKWIKNELDPSGGTNYSNMGTHQLLSVPYALFAGNLVSDSDSQILSLSGDTLSISNGNSVKLPSTSNPLSSNSINLQLGENINYGDAVVLGDGISGYKVVSSGGFGSPIMNGGSDWLAQTFKTSAQAKGIRGIRIIGHFQTGNTTITISIRNISGGLPVGGDLGSITTSIGNNSGIIEGGDFYFVFNPPVNSIQPNTEYAFVIRGQWNDCEAPAVGTYTDGQVAISNNGVTWTAQTTRDIYFETFEVHTELGKVYKSNASLGGGLGENASSCWNCSIVTSTLDLYSRFIGFSLETGNKNEFKPIGFGQVVLLPLSLNIGKTYYLSNTPAGAISEIPGTQNHSVGVAVSPNNLLITR